MKLDKRGRSYLRVGPAVTSVLTGQEDVSAWSDVELLRGARRGHPVPKVIPAECYRELTKRRMDTANEVLRDSLVDAVKLWQTVVLDENAPLPERLKASQMIVERVMGKPKESLDLKLAVEEPAWVQAQRVVYEWSDSESGSDTDPVQSQTAQLRTQQGSGLTSSSPPDIIDADVIEDSAQPSPLVPVPEPEPDDADDWDDVVDSDDYVFPEDDE